MLWFNVWALLLGPFRVLGLKFEVISSEFPQIQDAVLDKNAENFHMVGIIVLLPRK